MLVLFFAKDMHSGMRSNIEAQIKAKMGDVVEARNNCRISFDEKHSTSCGLASSVERNYKLNKMQCEWNLFCSKKTRSRKENY
jgi:hypothetical protein